MPRTLDRRIETIDGQPSEWFVYLKPGYRLSEQHCFGEETKADIRRAMKDVTRCRCVECIGSLAGFTPKEKEMYNWAIGGMEAIRQEDARQPQFDVDDLLYRLEEQMPSMCAGNAEAGPRDAAAAKRAAAKVRAVCY